MGSQLTLCERNTVDYKSQATVQDIAFEGNFQKTSQKIKIHPLSQGLSDLLVIKKPFQRQLDKIRLIKKVNFKGNTYIGEVTTLRVPHGWGKMYYKNGDVIIGQFNKGIPDGNCFYGKNDGSYRQGILVEGKLNCQNGVYYCKDFQYIGGFKNNQYHGKGKIIKANYVVQGQFIQGKLKQGKLQWQQTRNKCYTYHGAFNQNMEMVGMGILEQPSGTYKGQFKNNMKHGNGEYQYKDGKRFTGKYQNGLKNGYGELISKYQEIVYKGQWIDDMPAKQNQQVLMSASALKSSAKLQRADTLRTISTMDC